MKIKPRPGERGSAIRLTSSGNGFRDIVAMGCTVLQSAADGASATLAFTFAEEGVLDRLVLMANAATALVAGADAALNGCYVTTLSLNGNAVISGHVPASSFSERSFWSPVFGHTIVPGSSQLSLIVLNQTGATLEIGAAFTVR